MIWKQDGDPPHTRKGWLRCLYDAPGGGPLVQELWRFTAHETADTVTQILSGDGVYRGFGMYRSLWREEAEAEEPKRMMSPKEIRRIKDGEAIMREHSRVARSLASVNERLHKAQFTAFYAPKVAKKKIKHLHNRKRALLARLRIIREQRARFRREHG